MDSLRVMTHSLETLLDDLRTVAQAQMSGAAMEAFWPFVRCYCRRLDLDDLQGRHVSDVLGSIQHWWRILSQFDGKKPRVHVFNPVLESDGWTSTHSQLAVLQKDMPFLVDSLRMELNRRGLAIHVVKSTLLSVVRDKNGTLLQLEENPQKGQREALVIMEFNRVSDETTLRSIHKSLEEVLQEVATVVADYPAFVEQAHLVARQLADNKMLENCEESCAFLNWLVDDNFTFTGYTEFDFFQADDGERHLRENTDTRLGLFRLAPPQQEDKPESEWNQGIHAFYQQPELIAFSKSAWRSRVHRHAYSDYIVIKRFDKNGNVCGEARLMGLYTARVYTMSPTRIPLIRRKVEDVFNESGLPAASHDGKALRQVLETFPRDELFHSSCRQLFETVMGVVRINERYQVRLFMRRDRFGKFVTAVVYVPRDLFTTRLRQKIQELLAQAVHADEYDFTTYFSESILARVHMVFRLIDGKPPAFDVHDLECQITDIARAWEDHLLDELHEMFGEEQANRIFSQYRNAFPSAYREHFEPRTAIQDIGFIDSIGEPDQLAMSFYQAPGVSDHRELRFKIFSRDDTLALSDVIPVLEQLGLRVVSEHPYHIRLTGGDSVWLHDFSLSHELNEKINVRDIRDNFQDAFSAIWQGKADNDAFNRLVIAARFDWREVSVLRAYACYMRQTQFIFSENYIAEALVNQVAITRKLIRLFKARFDPGITDNERRQHRLASLHQEIMIDLDRVPNLNEDRIIRRYLAMIDATLRCNFFQRTSSGDEKPYLAFKLSPQAIADIPEPRPCYEIFIYSPRMEAVHLRGGKVARGGLRWSDRLQDYRTEVLGLMKAQQVKNAVIVPNGAKGGFVCKQLPASGGRDAMQQEAIACYQWFIRGMLDLTDNLVNGEIVTPANIVRQDDDDPYLVVAADKGTASFSDIANAVSQEYNFWLGDAFASGGSNGYDHKGMGITARGAWVSVQRHFKEMGVNIQEQDFTVIGIGDMAGDVFGNGMLLSEHTLLLAAFNHQHIFIDPYPDAGRSFTERKRLFELPRSSWADYDNKLISRGGGVFSRDSKSIDISPEMRERFAIHENSLTPSALIHALLKAPVDLLWNGGIGTYVKASRESHDDVGDKTNDSVRVNGSELNCKVIGEGGNLGMTQLGRVEYCLNGGACNTDFIDNAAGVDCSDHEVNIKILLNEAIETGDLTEKQRNQLLVDMTDNVASLVLHNNYRQTQAISLAQSDVLHRSAEYRRIINSWQNQGRLDRRLEFLPDDEILAERESQGIALTRPELSVLVSHAKVILKNDLAEAGIAEDPFISRYALQAFPQQLHKPYTERIKKHRLLPELVATQVANNIVNTMGISFAQRLIDSTGVDAGDMARAFIITGQVFNLEQHWQALENLDYRIDPASQLELMADMMRRIRRAARWFLRNRRNHLQPEAAISHFGPAVAEVMNMLPDFLQGDALAEWQERRDRLQGLELPQALVDRLAVPGHLYSGLSVVEAASHTDTSLAHVAGLFYALSDCLELYRFAGYISDLVVDSYWQAMARESYLDDLEQQLRNLTLNLCRFIDDKNTPADVVSLWSQQQGHAIERWQAIMHEIQNAGPNDYAIVSVALRELLELVQISADCQSLAD